MRKTLNLFKLSKTVACVGAIGALIAGSAAIALNTPTAGSRMLAKLEEGKVLTSKVGSSITYQALVNKDPMLVQQTLFSDLGQISKVLPQVAFAKAYTTSSGKRLVYLKIRGVQDGLGVLMEVKDGLTEAFDGAKALNDSAVPFQYRDTASEVDLKDDKALADVATAASKGNRSIAIGQSIVLEGPLNYVQAFPNLRLIINASVGSYSGAGDATQAYLVAKVSFGTQVSKEELGDFRGFKDREMSLAALTGTDVISVLKTRLAGL